MISTQYSKLLRWGLVMLTALALGGCAAKRLSNDGLDKINHGEYEEGVAKLEQAAKSDPENLHYRVQFINKREEVANRLLHDAASERAAAHLDNAEKLYQRVLVIDPINVDAKAGLDEVAKDRHHLVLLDESRALLKNGDMDGALAKLQPALIENPANVEVRELKREIEAQQTKEMMGVPTLKSLYKKPISLEFRDANLKMVFEVLSRTSGINFILDKDVRPDLTTTIFVKRSSLENVVDLLLTTSQLQKKILDSNTVLIYPRTPEKIREYQELMVKSFYIENADVKQTMAMVKSLLKTRDIFVDEKLNLMIMRDSPEVIRLAEKLIAMQDLAEPEVMLEVEVLEVTRSRLLNLGIQYPSQLTLTPLAVNLAALKATNATTIGSSTGNLSVNAQKTDGDVNLLANPRIRTRNREQAKIMIGDRVPVITTTTSSTGFVSDSVQYVDVGIKLDVTPNIYLQDEVAIKVALEVSSIANQVTSKNGTQAYQIGSRTASTVLRLKDGETQVLAGLINSSDQDTANKIPGLGDLPILGRLFSNHNNNKGKTEIVLSITPHLVRNLKRPNAHDAEFWSGSEAILRTTPLLMQPIKTGDSATPAKNVANIDTPNASMPTEEPTSASSEINASVPTSIGITWKGPKQVKVGEQFQVNLMLKTNGGLQSLPYQLGYNPDVLKVVEVAEGNYFNQDGGQTSFTSNVDVVNGRIFVGVVRHGNGGIAGDNSVSKITFKALKPLNTELKLLTATPVGSSIKMPSPDLPDPYSLTISE